MKVLNGGPALDIDEAVLFPFDEYSVPLRYRLQVGLVPANNPYKPHPKVLEQGGAQDPDGLGLHYYGTVIRVEDELRMWYGGMGDDGDERGMRLCYAVSKDGINWEKPDLGLVEFNGSKQNNLAHFPSQHNARMNAILVLYEPEDPDPNRRFKLINEVNPFVVIAAFSPDGLHWTESAHNPILKHNAVEPGGLMKFGDRYYLNGQGGNVGSKRALVTFMSYDFDHWTDAVTVGLRRDRPPYPQMAGPHAGEQVHLGASLWNRGNVVLGLYGMWHGESNDRAFISMDLGFVVSNDGYHFTEPVPDLQIISVHEIIGDVDATPSAPKAEQGQGFENVGDETLIWYWGWRAGYICVARWLRDRLGYVEVVPDPKPRLLMPEDTHAMFWKEHVDLPIEATEPHAISAPIQLGTAAARVFINADGLSAQSSLKVEILDEQFSPLPDYSGNDCMRLTESGLRQPVAWRGKQALKGLERPFRVKVSWTGTRPEDANLYAAYVTEQN